VSPLQNQEGDRLRKEKRNLETDKNEAEKESNRHLIRLSALEQEVILLILLFRCRVWDCRMLHDDLDH
jgi:hypothetical protein